LRRLRPLVGNLRDEIDVLAHRLAAAAARPDDELTLLFECVGAPVREAIVAALSCSPRRLFRVQGWLECPDEGGRLVWTELGHGNARLNIRRAALSCVGPGLAELLAPLAGWALLETVRDGASLSVPVRLSLLQGVGPEAVAEYDRRVAGEREARRRAGASGMPPEPGVVVLRQEGRAGRLVHVATGREASQDVEIAAAHLRARGEGA
jgi:ATP-dependent Clp protease ATP-binding subunit ClpC